MRGKGYEKIYNSRLQAKTFDVEYPNISFATLLHF